MPVRVKPLVIEMVARRLPEFRPITSKRRGYWFRRDSCLPYREFVVIQSNAKENILGCDIAWSFLDYWNGLYGTHQMRAATELVCVRLGSNAVRMEDTFYIHDGTETGIRDSLDKLGGELLEHAIPWFAAKKQGASDDILLQHGLEWLRLHMDAVPATIAEDLERAIVESQFRAWRMQIPILDELKAELRDFAYKIEASPFLKKETGTLAQDLLVYAAHIKRIGGNA